MDGESACSKAEEVYVSYVEDAVTFWGQSFNRIHEMSKISETLADVCPTLTPIYGAPNPDKVYGGMFSADMCWYRCKLQRMVNDEQCAVTYIDYGNSEVLNRSSIVELPDNLQMQPVAQKYRLWGLQLQTSSDIEQGVQFISRLIGDKHISVQQKTTYKDGTIVVRVLLDDLDVGDEVAKKGFAERCKLSNSLNESWEARDIATNNGKGRCFWPVRPVERLPMREPKSVPICNKFMLEHTAVEQRENHGINHFQTTRLPAEVNDLNSDQRYLEKNKLLKEENKHLKDELKQMKIEKDNLLEKLRSLELHFQKMEVDLKKKLKLFEQTIFELEERLKSAAGTRLKDVTTKIDLLRTVRCGHKNIHFADHLLEAVKVVSEAQLSVPSTLNTLEDNWKDYYLAQEEIRSWKLFATKEYIEGLLLENCGHINKPGTNRKPEVELDLLIDKRNKIQQTLNGSVGDFIVDVEAMPLDERLNKLQMLLHSIEGLFDTTEELEIPDTVFEEFFRWKENKLLTFTNVRNGTDTSLKVLSTWFSNIKECFDLASSNSTSNPDDLDKIDYIMEKVDADISKELEVSLMEPNEKEQNILKNAHFKVVKQISEETCLIETIKSKYLSSIEFKKNSVEWINRNPNLDDLIEVKKTIKGLKAQLRWKLLECCSMEEADEYNETAHCELKNEIALLRSKIFSQIQCEQMEYAMLSNLVQKWFPELPLIYPDAGILNYMRSGGLLSSSMERTLFDAEPMKELSSKRPLLRTNVQDRIVLLKRNPVQPKNSSRDYFQKDEATTISWGNSLQPKNTLRDYFQKSVATSTSLGYSVGVDTEEHVIVRATEYHKAWMQQKEKSGIMELMYLFFCKSDPMVYLMVPFYPWESLSSVQASNPLNSYEIVKVMSGVADGMETLHDSCIIIGSLHENNVFAVNREKGIIGDFDFTRDAEQRSSATSLCFPLLTAPELKIGMPASAASDVYAYGIILLWGNPVQPKNTLGDYFQKTASMSTSLLCTGHQDFVLKPDGTPDLQRIDMDLCMKDLLSGLLCSGNRTPTKQIKDHKYFLTVKALLCPPSDENGETSSCTPADFA